MNVTLPMPLTPQQEVILSSIEHELRVLAALSLPLADVPFMDRRRVDATMEVAQDTARVRVAALYASLQATVG